MSANHSLHFSHDSCSSLEETCCFGNPSYFPQCKIYHRGCIPKMNPEKPDIVTRSEAYSSIARPDHVTYRPCMQAVQEQIAERMGMQFVRGKPNEGKKCCIKNCGRAINCRTRRPLHVFQENASIVLGAAALAIPLSAFGLLDNTDKLSSLKTELIQVLRAERHILEVTKLWEILT